MVNYNGGTETGDCVLVAYPFLPSEPASSNGLLPGMVPAGLDVGGNRVLGSASGLCS
jgi:acetyl-CoA synthetase